VGAARPETTCDYLGRFRFRQPRQGYRFSIDSVLLADFAPASSGPVADLGAGCGVLCLLLAGRGLPGPFSAFELDTLAADCCRQNFVSAGMNGLVMEHDLNHDHPALAANSFDMVVSNPPFGKAEAGRLPPEPARARARHELNLEPGRLWELAARLLPAGGRLALCWPPARLVELMGALPPLGLMPKRLRMVHGRAERPASLVLLEAVKGGREELIVMPPLTIYGQGQEYTPEVAAIYKALD
jgi:tRNA1Val (adenine37-N6)-methyltransferase